MCALEVRDEFMRQAIAIRGVWLVFVGLFVMVSFSVGEVDSVKKASVEKPNVLFIIMDDQSWAHLGCYGDPAIRTPGIDQIAENGLRFDYAYSAAPSCAPARAGILTGQDVWRLEDGGILWGCLSKKFQVFPLILKDQGYYIGSTGKGYWPITVFRDDVYTNPLGARYERNHFDRSVEGAPFRNYTGNFKLFLEDVPKGSPFFFWCGVAEPHIPYAVDYGKNSGIDLAKIKVPAFLPDTPEVRLSLANYLAEIEYADKQVGEMIQLLRDRNLLDDTLVIFTSDNGMPFPRAKATLYDYGARMPFLMQWNGRITPGRVVTDPVSLTDVAPTLLDLAGIEVPSDMTGKSLKKTMLSSASGRVDMDRNFVVSALEYHTGCRPDKQGYPRRAIHTEKWTYIINIEPDRYSAGTEDIVFSKEWGPYGDVDPTIAKFYILDHRNEPAYSKYFEDAFGKLPEEQLFDKEKDPEMLNDLAGNPEYSQIKEELRTSLMEYRTTHKDPRMEGLSPWGQYALDSLYYKKMTRQKKDKEKQNAKKK